MSESLRTTSNLMILVDFTILTFATVLSGWRDANVKINPLADDRDQPCGAIDHIASGHLAAVERKIADLELMRAELDRMLGSCRKGTVGDCKIIEALAPRAVSNGELSA